MVEATTHHSRTMATKSCCSNAESMPGDSGHIAVLRSSTCSTGLCPPRRTEAGQRMRSGEGARAWERLYTTDSGQCYDFGRPWASVLL